MEFENVKFRKSISFEDGVCREFLEIDSNSMFSKKCVLQKRNCFNPFFQSISYSLIVPIKIYFSPTFLKLWLHISDNIACVVGGTQYYQWVYR